MEMLLTVEQAAKRLQLTRYTVRQHLREGRLRGIKRGRDWRIPESALTEAPPARHTENPLARALALVEQLETELQNARARVAGVNDAAAEIRAMREKQTP